MEQFNLYIKSLENRILALETEMELDFKSDTKSEPEEIKEPIEEKDQKMRLSYAPDWRNDINYSNFTHISHCFIHRQEQWDNLREVKGKINGISIGGWNEREWLRNDIFNILNYTVIQMEERSWLKYLSIDLEYPKTNGRAIAILEYARDILPNNIKLCVACGLWRGHLSIYKDCNKYLDWIEIMAYDTQDILQYLPNSLKLLNDIGFPNDKILIGYSNDGDLGDYPESLEYKKRIIDKYLGLMLWNNPSGRSKDIKLPLYDIIEEEAGESHNEEVELGDIIMEDTFRVVLRYWDKDFYSTQARNYYDDISQFRGNGKVDIKYKMMKLSGSQPRFYVNVDWRDVEVEVEYMKIGKDGMNWSGGTIGVRSNIEGHSRSPEKAHTIYFRFRHDNKLNFYKEIEHGGETHNLAWKDYELSEAIWYKIKFKCYNIGSIVKYEGYINDVLELEYEDSDERMINASGVVFIRNTGIKEARYKNFVIKSI